MEITSPKIILDIPKKLCTIWLKPYGGNNTDNNPEIPRNKPKRSQGIPFNPALPVSKVNPIVNLDKALDLRTKGLTYEEIAKFFGVTKNAVIERINGYISEHTEIKTFQKYEADILCGKRSEIIKSLSEDEIKKASAYQRVGMYGILFDKERLLRGQSTENIAYADMSRDQKEMDREIQKLEAELGLSTSQEGDNG